MPKSNVFWPFYVWDSGICLRETFRHVMWNEFQLAFCAPSQIDPVCAVIKCRNPMAAGWSTDIGYNCPKIENNDLWLVYTVGFLPWDTFHVNAWNKSDFKIGYSIPSLSSVSWTMRLTELLCLQCIVIAPPMYPPWIPSTCDWQHCHYLKRGFGILWEPKEDDWTAQSFRVSEVRLLALNNSGNTYRTSRRYELMDTWATEFSRLRPKIFVPQCLLLTPSRLLPHSFTWDKPTVSFVADMPPPGDVISLHKD